MGGRDTVHGLIQVQCHLRRSQSRRRCLAGIHDDMSRSLSGGSVGFDMDDTGCGGHHFLQLHAGLRQGIGILTLDDHIDGIGRIGAGHGTAGTSGRRDRYIHSGPFHESFRIFLYCLLTASAAFIHRVGSDNSLVLGDAQTVIFKFRVIPHHPFDLRHLLIHDRQLCAGPEVGRDRDTAVVIRRNQFKGQCGGNEK